MWTADRPSIARITDAWEKLASDLPSDEPLPHPDFEPTDAHGERRWTRQAERLFGPRQALGKATRIPPFVLDGAAEPSIEPPLPEDVEGVSRRGLDHLAWYLSFHFDRRSWGIYITERGLHHVASFLPGGLDPLFRLQCAFDCLHAHEYFHFLVDIATTAIELPVRSDLYRPYVRACKVKSPPYNELEEALANAHAISPISRQASGLRAGVRAFMAQQPSGYRDHASVSGKDADRVALERLVSQVLDPSDGLGLPDEAILVLEALANAEPALPLAELLFDRRGRVISPADVPIYVVPDPTLPASGLMRLITTIQMIHETDRFKADLRRLPKRTAEQWVKVKALLAMDVRATRFEKLTNCDTVFSVRLDRSIRATLRPSGDGWEALRVGQHDDVYRRPI